MSGFCTEKARRSDVYYRVDVYLSMRNLSETNPPELASPAGHLTNYTIRRHAEFPTTTRILEIDFM